MTDNSPKSKRKENTPLHSSAFMAFSYGLHEYLENGNVTLEFEHQLAKAPLRIDIMIIKKNREVEIKTSWGRIFRGHNIIEYKSPNDPPPNIHVFDKTIHGYAGIYASQKKVKLTDMSATIVCLKKPAELFETLKKQFNYRVLRKDKGIYYILPKGFAAEKALAVQVVVSSELDEKTELPLNAIRSGISNETAKAIIKRIETDKTYAKYLAKTWLETVVALNKQIFLKELDMNVRKELAQYMAENGILVDFEQKWRQEGEQKGERKGMQKGMQKVVSLLEKGYSVADVKKKLQLA